MGREGDLQAAPEAMAALEHEIDDLRPLLENYLQQATVTAARKER